MDNTQTTHVSLCSGYGGIDLGLRRILPNLRTIAYVEIEAFACANLVEKMEQGSLDAAPIWTDLKTFDAKPFFNKVDILSGGFPCQPFSHAGQRKGTDDPRHLFPFIERIITNCKPNIIFLENVEGIISAKYGGEEGTSVLKYVLGRLEALGYRAEAGIFSAEEVAAPHRRKRVFIAGIRELSNYDSERFIRKSEGNSQEGQLEKSRWHDFDGQSTGELADPRCDKRRGRSAVGEKQEGNGGEKGEGQTSCEGRKGEAGEWTKPKSSDECSEVGNTTGNGCNEGKSITQTGGIDGCSQEGGMSESSGGCCKLGNAEHDGQSAAKVTGSTGSRIGRCTTRKETAQQSQGSDSSKGRDENLANTDSKHWGRQQGQGQSERESVGECTENDCGELGNATGERSQRHAGGFSREEEPSRERTGNERNSPLRSLFPSRPSEPQQFWEAPRTISNEEVITAMGGATYGIANGSMVHSCRVDALRLLGNGVVPATCEKAFVVLMNRLVE